MALSFHLRPSFLIQQSEQHLKPAIQRASRRLKPIETLATLGTKAATLLPAPIVTRTLEPLLNHALKELVATGELDFLEGRICAIAVRDQNRVWPVTLLAGRLYLQMDAQADVTISATVPAFLQLLSQSTDPDTLFFQRALSIDGDVELGLFVKNLLDALDQDDLPFPWQQALQKLKQLIEFEQPPV